MIHNKEIMNLGIDIAKQCSEVNTNLPYTNQRTFPLKKKRFGELSIDENFFYHEKKLKKINDFNAISISKFSKSDYLFGRGDLVDIEDLDHLLVDPQVKKSSESLMQRLIKQPIFDKLLNLDTSSNNKVLNKIVADEVLKSIHIRYEGEKNTPFYESFLFISTNLDPEEKIFSKTPENCWDIDLGQQKAKMSMISEHYHNSWSFSVNVSLKTTSEGTMNVYFDNCCILTISKETLKIIENGNKLTINID